MRAECCIRTLRSLNEIPVIRTGKVKRWPFIKVEFIANSRHIIVREGNQSLLRGFQLVANSFLGISEIQFVANDYRVIPGLVVQSLEFRQFFVLLWSGA